MASLSKALAAKTVLPAKNTNPNLPHLLLEPHFQQPVRLIQHQHSQVLQPKALAVADVVDDAA